MTPHSFIFLLYTSQMESGVNKENNIGFCFYLFKFILLPEKKEVFWTISWFLEVLLFPFLIITLQNSPGIFQEIVKTRKRCLLWSCQALLPPLQLWVRLKNTIRSHIISCSYKTGGHDWQRSVYSQEPIQVLCNRLQQISSLVPPETCPKELASAQLSPILNQKHGLGEVTTAQMCLIILNILHVHLVQKRGLHGLCCSELCIPELSLYQIWQFALLFSYRQRGQLNSE